MASRDKPPATEPAQQPRIVVTGMGIVSSIGIGKAAFRDALCAGKSVVTPIRSFDTTGYLRSEASEIHDLAHLQADYAAMIDRQGRSSCLAVLASREAVRDAGLSGEQLREAEAGVLIGTTNGESQILDRIVRGWLHEGPRHVPAADWALAPAHRISMAVAQDLALDGEAMMVATACAAGNYAIGHATDILTGGEAEIMICGGVDSLNRSAYSGFLRLNAITTDVVRPFEADRSGILTGEGAAVLVLETMEHALRRNAPIQAEILGYASNCDAHHMTAPKMESISECIRTAHRRAGVVPADIDLISAHGTGTRTNDVTEVAAIHQVFGDRAPPTISIKSMLGHSMGASSAMGTIACVLAMQNSFIPPTVNFRNADPECPIDCVPNVGRPQELSIVENHGFAFGGNNAILILRRAPGPGDIPRRAPGPHDAFDARHVP
ncbi:MAG TPA: beta-ketoacyl-[acyl-carrier-protein] synthase family protein [Rhodopila sp.]|jgi:3-oxoacyl-[acyl-carrier-protein] synthase II|nr:beta-ketoacyl-[acyl-carrier-protein] synthase family protein [Rhodopila sp.]